MRIPSAEIGHLVDLPADRLRSGVDQPHRSRFPKGCSRRIEAQVAADLARCSQTVHVEEVSIRQREKRVLRNIIRPGDEHVDLSPSGATRVCQHGGRKQVSTDTPAYQPNSVGQRPLRRIEIVHADRWRIMGIVGCRFSRSPIGINAVSHDENPRW